MGGWWQRVWWWWSAATALGRPVMVATGLGRCDGFGEVPELAVNWVMPGLAVN